MYSNMIYEKNISSGIYYAAPSVPKGNFAATFIRRWGFYVEVLQQVPELRTCDLRTYAHKNVSVI
jgi:hypothetical protein